MDRKNLVAHNSIVENVALRNSNKLYWKWLFLNWFATVCLFALIGAYCIAFVVTADSSLLKSNTTFVDIVLYVSALVLFLSTVIAQGDFRKRRFESDDKRYKRVQGDIQFNFRILLILSPPGLLIGALRFLKLGLQRLYFAFMR